MSTVETSRLDDELELLHAMYPEQISFEPRSRDLKFTDNSAVLHLRLPEQYPETGFPEVVAGKDFTKNDVRDLTKSAIKALGLGEGEEAIDAIIACFQSTMTRTDHENDTAVEYDSTKTASSVSDSNKTAITWLHHLLALTKRKLALSPAPTVSGITKPGYPGVMLFSGPAAAVDEHINILKAENWQAFQVRYSENELWEFAHGREVREVETMADIVKAVEVGNDGPKRKQDFLKAVGIK
ncbi:hypothetical protein P154DRAFT_517120 [Amniculicola lignicola CBS 123094]|uniref:RWD domain-containing protein n=1 Tax=Amniculicola lignicola CBS 123094 TaxID=1392246 RepID=A0A6A5X383_9PLEO|nr:hypothetical protein P154DRAFT_517120 [Amniculicola lignicola CBS 123094]